MVDEQQQQQQQQNSVTGSPLSAMQIIQVAEIQQQKPIDIENDPRTEGMDDEAKARYELYLQSKTDNLIRFDITINLLRNMAQWQREDFLIGLPKNRTIKTIHLSGHKLDTVYNPEQIVELVTNGIGNLHNLQELFIFQGNCHTLNEELVSKCITKATNVRVLMLWQFKQLSTNGIASSMLAGSLRMHPNIERLTINLPTNFVANWSCMDLYIMAFSGMPKLRVLQIRCDYKKRQEESIISTDAIVLLMNSTSIESLYLENVGLLDDHVDAICEELMTNTNKTLRSIDLKDNLFTEDVLYTFGRMLPSNTTIQSLDVSGCNITVDAGKALRDGILHKNYTLLHIEIEGVYEMYKNEFEIPDGYKYTEWMQDIYYQLRLNRAYNEAGSRKAIEMFPPTLTTSCHRLVTAINHVTDHLSCIYELVRAHTTIVINHITATPFVDIQL